MGPRRRIKRRKRSNHDDDDDDDDDDDEVGGGNKDDSDLELVDIGIARSSSHARQFNAVHKIFNKFLAFQYKDKDHPLYNKKYKDLNSTDITQTLFGMFVDYLLRGRGCPSESTAMNYISSMKGSITKDHNIIIDPEWYRFVRKNTSKYYMKNGQVSSQRDNVMTQHELTYFCEVLFKMSTRESINDRGLLAFNWVLLGRISEISELKWSDISFRNTETYKHMTVDVARIKVNHFQSKLSVFLHHSDWKVCPFHALATMLVVNGKSEDKLFDSKLHYIHYHKQ